MKAVNGVKSRTVGWEALAFVALLTLILGYAFGTGYLPVRFFDSGDWRSADYWSGHRVQMIDHLLWSGQLNGLTKPQVIYLLGPETETSYFSEFDFVYSLGPERGFFSIDSEWLVINFDENGVVSTYQIVRD
ncbi:hypothetical protein [Erythrobacter sp. Alg231-14]|uniref:hypothetical protein n=1 Tax=Erythrobacter sp. Alg231-14 TaxID=1922225 RepID=UPI00307CA0FB